MEIKGSSKKSKPSLSVKPGKRNKFGLFDVTGIELEYMIVDKKTLSVKPLCDKIMESVAGKVVSGYDNGGIFWSNEIVKHVIELKTNGPVSDIANLHLIFGQNVLQINHILNNYGAMLLPSGVHPWMDPIKETRLWDHDSNKIYNLYNEIFDCRGHGWSNLQSTHLNLPFGNDEEFGRLHAAVRILLPLIPAVCASSPVLDSKPTGYHDARLETYRLNQQKIPSITGKVIPECAFSKADYYKLIFEPMMKDIAPYDPENILECHFLNSRGAIARFDRGSIEIRIMDIQECPLADLAITEAILNALKILIFEVEYSLQKGWHENSLYNIFLNTVKEGENAVISDSNYLLLWGMERDFISAGELWRFLYGKFEKNMNPELSLIFKQIVDEGTLSTRIMRYINGDHSFVNIKKAYSKLAICLQENKLFINEK